MIPIEREQKWKRVILPILFYWVLATPALLKVRGGYVLAQEFSNEIVESLLYWLYQIRLLAGDGLPFWTPYFHAGYPLVGNVKIALLHPITLLTMHVDPVAVLNTVMFAGPAVAASFMWLYARRLGLSPFGSWLGGLLYGFHTFHASQLYVIGDWNYMLSFWLVPLLFYAALRVAEERDPAAVGILGLSSACLLLAGNFPLALLIFLVLLIHFPLFISCPGQTLSRSLPLLVGGVALGALIALPHLAPLYHFIRQTGNSVPMNTARDYPLGRLLPEHLVSLVFPRFFGDNVNSVYWGRLTYSSLAIYSGVATLVLIVFSILVPLRRRLAVGVLILSVLTLVLSAELFPVFGKLCSIPGWLQWTKSPAFFLSVFPLLAAFLGAIGWDAIMSKDIQWRRRLGQTLVGLVIILAAVGWLYLGRSGGTGLIWKSIVFKIVQDPLTSLAPEVVQKLLGNEQFIQGCFEVAYISVIRSLIFLLCFGLLLVFGYSRSQKPRAATFALTGLLFASDLVGFFHSQESIYPTALLNLPKSIADYLKEKCGNDYRVLAPLDPDLCLAPARHGIRSAWARTPFVYKDLHDLVRVQERQPTFYAPGLMLSRITPLTKAMGVRTLVTRPNSSYRSDECTVTQQTSSVWAYEMTSPPLRRAYFPRRVTVTTQPALMLFSVASLDWNPKEVAYVSAQDLLPSSLSVEQDFEATATVVRETGREIRIAFSQSTTSPVTLIISDIFDPWWHAYAAGNEVPINKANYAFRSVLVPAGVTELRLAYEVPYWRTVVCISLAGVMVAFTLVVGKFARQASRDTRKAD